MAQWIPIYCVIQSIKKVRPKIIIAISYDNFRTDLLIALDGTVVYCAIQSNQKVRPEISIASNYDNFRTDV